MIRTLVVEDDFRVARVHAEFAGSVPGFAVIAQVHSAAAALDAAARQRLDLVLLDVYLPDAGGLELLRRLRARPDPPDAIVLTAASDMATVREAMRAGALHYLIKPFAAEALRERLRAFADLHARRSVDRRVDQREVDALFASLRRGGDASAGLPKGRSSATAALVLEVVGTAAEPLSAGDVAERTGVSRATAQRYLTSLLEAGVVRLTLRYGTAGRPEHRFEPTR